MKKPQKDRRENLELKLDTIEDIEDIEEVEIIETGNFCTCTSTVEAY